MIPEAGGDHPSLATSYNNLGFVENRFGHHEAAKEWYEKGLAIQLATLGINVYSPESDTLIRVV